MSTDLETFLEEIIPDILRCVQKEHTFSVIGTRAIRAYTNISPISTHDWDVLYYGDNKGQLEFSQKVEKRVQDKGYKVITEVYEGVYNSSRDPYTFRSHQWVRLSVSLGGDANVTFLDVYRINAHVPGMGVFIIKNGLLYSDLGFLVHQLDRPDYSKHFLEQPARLSILQVKNKIISTTRMLKDIQVKKSPITQGIKRALQNERDELFAVVTAGNTSKLVTEQICKICRDVEGVLCR